MKKPKPPRFVSAPLEIAENREAKEEWVRITRVLADKLDERDRSLLTDYCLCVAEISELRITVHEEGYTLQGEKGGSYTNPTVNVLSSRMSHLAQLRRDLYFTPRSRIEKQRSTTTLSKAKSIRASVQEDNDDES